MDGSGEGEDDDSVEFLGVSVPGQGRGWIIKREERRELTEWRTSVPRPVGWSLVEKYPSYPVL